MGAQVTVVWAFVKIEQLSFAYCIACKVWRTTKQVYQKVAKKADVLMNKKLQNINCWNWMMGTKGLKHYFYLEIFQIKHFKEIISLKLPLSRVWELVTIVPHVR